MNDQPLHFLAISYQHKRGYVEEVTLRNDDKIQIYPSKGNLKPLSFAWNKSFDVLSFLHDHQNKNLLSINDNLFTGASTPFRALSFQTGSMLLDEKNNYYQKRSPHFFLGYPIYREDALHYLNNTVAFQSDNYEGIQKIYDQLNTSKADIMCVCNMHDDWIDKLPTLMEVKKDPRFIDLQKFNILQDGEWTGIELLESNIINGNSNNLPRLT